MSQRKLFVKNSQQKIALFTLETWRKSAIFAIIAGEFYGAIIRQLCFFYYGLFQ